jgi:hypothetical protein
MLHNCCRLPVSNRHIALSLLTVHHIIHRCQCKHKAAKGLVQRVAKVEPRYYLRQLYICFSGVSLHHILQGVAKHCIKRVVFVIPKALQFVRALRKPQWPLALLAYVVIFLYQFAHSIQFADIAVICKVLYRKQPAINMPGHQYAARPLTVIHPGLLKIGVLLYTLLAGPSLLTKHQLIAAPHLVNTEITHAAGYTQPSGYLCHNKKCFNGIKDKQKYLINSINKQY